MITWAGVSLLVPMATWRLAVIDLELLKEGWTPARETAGGGGGVRYSQEALKGWDVAKLS